MSDQLCPRANVHKPKNQSLRQCTLCVAQLSMVHLACGGMLVVSPHETATGHLAASACAPTGPGASHRTARSMSSPSSSAAPRRCCSGLPRPRATTAYRWAASSRACLLDRLSGSTGGSISALVALTPCQSQCMLCLMSVPPALQQQTQPHLQQHCSTACCTDTLPTQQRAAAVSGEQRVGSTAGRRRRASPPAAHRPCGGGPPSGQTACWPWRSWRP